MFYWILIVSIIFCSSAYAAGIADIETALMDKDYAKVGVLSQEVLKSPVVNDERRMAEYYLGLSQLRLGDNAQARKTFQAVKETARSRDMRDKASLGIAEALYAAGFYKDALKEGESLLHKSPNSALLSLVYLKLARTNLKLMQWQKAKSYLNQIITRFPQSMEYGVAKQLLEEKEYFSVQVGAFMEQERAVQLTEGLKGEGEYAYIVETTSAEGKKFFRVRVGQISSLDQAQALESKLSQQGYPTLIYP